MNRIVFDSYAFIALFRHEPGGPFVEEQLLNIAKGDTEGWLSSVNLGEVFYMMARKGNVEDAASAVSDILQWPVIIEEPTTDFCLLAAELKIHHKISYADAFAAALTIQKKATLITGDKEFNSLIKETNFKVKYI